MQKNWYIIYTKAKCEKKVASVFTKKRIENFIPLKSKQLASGRKRKTVQLPLFESYVFANIEAEQINKIKMIDGVINLLYWKQEPAIIHQEEIQIIREFIADYQDITIEKTRVDVNDVAKVIDGSRYSIEGNILTVKNTTVKVNLPSIGFALVAKVTTENSLHSQVPFANKTLLLQ
jgi:transcription antitermination factor NusG